MLSVSRDLATAVVNPEVYLEARLRALFELNVQGSTAPSIHQSFLRGELFQDAAGTTPVTTIGQPVGFVTDWSGQGQHMVQTTADKRPTLQQDGNGIYTLLFDGVDDNLVSTGGNITFGTQATAVFGYRPLDLTTLTKYLFNAGNNAISRLGLLTPGGTVNRVVASAAADTLRLATDSDQTAGLNVISSVVSNSVTPKVNIRRNGTQRGTNALDQGTGTYPTSTFAIGSLQNGTANFYNGHLYGYFVINKELQQHELSWVEAYVNLYTKGIE